MVSEKRRIVRNTLAYSVVQLAQMASSFAFMPFLIRRFGLADYGVYLLAVAVSGYMGLLDFGVGTTVIKLVAQYKAEADEDRLSRLLSNVFFFYVAVGVVAAVSLGLFSRFGVGVFNLAPAGQQLARNLFLLSAGISLVSWPANLGGLVLSGIQEYSALAKVALTVTVANIAATSLVLVTHQGPVMLLAVNGFTGVAGGVLYHAAARRRMPGIRASLRKVSVSMLRVIFRISWVMFVFQICSLIIYQQTDRVVLGLFVGATAVALYEAPSKVQTLVSQLSGMMGTAVLPAASQFEAEKRLETLQALFLRGTKYVVAFITPIVITLIVIARPLLLHWLGPQLATQDLAAQIFVSFWLVFANLQVASAMLTGMGRLRFILGYAIALTLGNIVLSVILVQFLDVLGVVLGTVITNLVVAPFVLSYTLRVLHLDTRRWLRDVVLPTYPLLALPLGIAVLGRVVGLADSLVGVAVVAMLSVAGYWIALYFVGLSRAERTDLKELAGAALARLGVGARP